MRPTSMYMYMYANIKGLKMFSIHVQCIMNYTVICFFRGKNIFVRRKHTKIILTNIIIQRKFLERIFTTSTRNKNLYYAEIFWHKIYYTKKNKLRYAKRILKIGWLLKLRTEWNRTEQDAP